MNGVLEQVPMTSDPIFRELLLGYLHGVDAHFWPGLDGMTVDVILDSYCLAAAAGQVPGKDELLRRHPDLADAIDAFFVECGNKRGQRSQSTPPALYSQQTD